MRARGIPIAGPPAQRHRIALLSLLVASWPQPLTRDRVIALLWPERDTAGARRLLNLAVHVLRSALGEETIVSTSDSLLLDPSRIWCDLLRLREAMATGELEQVVQLYTGPFLDGFHLGESAEFGYWLDERRNQLAHEYVGILRTLAARQEQSGDVHGLVGTCRRLVATDPYSGAHAQALMHALDAAGDRAGAIQYAAEHAQRLRDDLALPSDVAVAALANELRAGTPSQRAAPSLVRRQRARFAVAVLPFVSLGAEPGHGSFADGITEDVIAHLSKMRALSVIATTSVMAFKHRPAKLKEIGKSLGATILLDGTVRRVGERVRIVAKLIDVENDKHLWVETYDRQLTDIFAIQTEVALHIAAALEAELSSEEQTRVRREPTRDVQAYQLFLQGRQSFIKYTPMAMTRATEYFEQAIARDPTFALAYALLGMTYAELSEHGATAPEVASARAREATQSALRLDPELSAAHCTLGHLKTIQEYDWIGAEQEFKRALELSPSNAAAHALYGRLCAALERYDESLALHTRARELDPLAHRLDLVTTLLRAGRNDEAVIRAEEACNLDPEYGRARATLGWAYFLTGRTKDGIAELERAVALSSDSSLWLGQLGQAYAMAGESAKAQATLRKLEALSQKRFVSPYHFAYVYTGLGDADRAVSCLERAVSEHTGPAYSIKGSFLLTSLHGHPRFQSLLTRMRLA